MSSARRRLILRAAAVLTLVSGALMVYSMLFPKPITVVLAMSLGQGIGILGVVGYLYVVIHDGIDRRLSIPPAPRKETPKP